jgi:hypothetical protein
MRGVLVWSRAGGVADHHIEAFVHTTLDGIEDDGARVRAVLALGDLALGAAAPGLQLHHRGGAVRVACDQQHLLAALGVARGQLADGGGLAHAVHADHQDDRRSAAGQREATAGAREDGGAFLAQGRPHRVRVRQLVALEPGLEGPQDLLRGGDTEVGRDQHLLELVQQGWVDLGLAPETRLPGAR